MPWKTMNIFMGFFFMCFRSIVKSDQFLNNLWHSVWHIGEVALGTIITSILWILCEMVPINHYKSITTKVHTLHKKLQHGSKTYSDIVKLTILLHCHHIRHCATDIRLKDKIVWESKLFILSPVNNICHCLNTEEKV